MVKHYSLTYSLFLIISDVLLIWGALLSATITRIHIPLGLKVDTSVWTLPFPVYLIAAIIWSVVFSFLNVYTPAYHTRLSKELQRVAAGSMVAWLLLVGSLYLSYREVSRLQTIYFLGFVLLYLWLYRLALGGIQRLRHQHHPPAHRVLVVGTGINAQEFAKRAQQPKWGGLDLVGFVDAASTGTASENIHPLLGTLDELPQLIEERDISELVIALPWEAQQGVPQLVRDLQYLPVNLRVIPDYFDMAFLSLRIEDFAGIPLVTLKEPVLSPMQRLTKRVFDLILTVLLLIPALPVMIVIAIAIKLDDGGPILFFQERVGEGRKNFLMFKFRSMRTDAHLFDADVIKIDHQGRIIHKTPDDPRVTRVGRFIRRTSLDELPQLFNILRGDMSLVGPRPEMPWLVEQYEQWQSKRFEVPQGLTGWWQINGRSHKLMHASTDEDLYYIRNYSIWLDIVILYRTIAVVLSGNGAF